jgi:hypothetical protein
VGRSSGCETAFPVRVPSAWDAAGPCPAHNWVGKRLASAAGDLDGGVQGRSPEEGPRAREMCQVRCARHAWRRPSAGRCGGVRRRNGELLAGRGRGGGKADEPSSRSRHGAVGTAGVHLDHVATGAGAGVLQPHLQRHRAILVELGPDVLVIPAGVAEPVPEPVARLPALAVVPPIADEQAFVVGEDPVGGVVGRPCSVAGQVTVPNQASCWRSSPVARRKRRIGAAADASRAAMSTKNTSPRIAVAGRSPSTPSGLETAPTPLRSTGCGSTAAARVSSPVQTASAHATGSLSRPPAIHAGKARSR